MGKHRKYTIEFKTEICRKYFEDGVGQSTLAKEVGCSRSVIHRWINKYQLGGIEELAKETRGGNYLGRRNKTKFNSIEEELNYVKAECDVLKKYSEIQRRLINK